MKQTLRKLTAMVLCLSLCLSMGIAAFAADETNTLGVTYSASLDRAEIETSAEDQTVVMTVKASKPVTVDGVGFTTVWDDALTLTGIRGGAEIGNYNQVATNLANGIAGWSSPDAENVLNVTDLAVITFTVPANTPAGTYNVGVTKLELTKDYGEIWEDSASASAILTVTGTAVPPVPGEYKASISSDDSSVKVGDTVKVDVNVTGEDFSAAEIEVAYSDELTFESASANAAEASAADGVVTVVDYGSAETAGNGIYTLTFTAASAGTATVTLESAAFSTSEDAKDEDLTAASCDADPLTFTVGETAHHGVTLPDIFTGEDLVEDGTDYTFTLKDPAQKPASVTATVDGKPADVVDNGDGSYTVKNVTGALVITVGQPAVPDRSDSDDYREGEQDFWDSVVEAIKKAGENQTVKVSAKFYDRMPVKVVEALKGSGVTLAIDWNGGGDIVLDESSLPKVERNRVYYPLSLLEKMQSEAKANVGGEDTAANPSTGIFAHLTAVDGMAVDVTPADAGLESTNTVLILLLAIAAAAVTGYAVYRSRKVD